MNNSIAKLLVLITSTPFFRCLYVKRSSGKLHQHMSPVSLQIAPKMDTKDEFDFDSKSHLNSRRNGILQVIAPLPTLFTPGDGIKSTQLNRSEESQNSRNNKGISSNYIANETIANEDKFLYRYVKGTKMKSDMIKSHDLNTTSRLQTFATEKVQQVEKPSPIEVLRKIADPYPETIPSIKSAQEQYQTIGPIKLDRLIDFPNIDDIPITDFHPLVSNEIHKREVYADNKFRVKKNHIFSQNTRCLSLENRFESLKTDVKKIFPDHYLRKKLKENVERNRYLGWNKRGHGAQKGKIKRDRIEHSFGNINACPPFFNQQCNLCALRGATRSKVQEKIFQKKHVERLVLKRKSGEVTGTVRVKIKPPETIKSIKTLLLSFEAAKKVANIQDHLMKPQSIEKILDIKKQLQNINQPTKVPPLPSIRDSVLKFKPRGSQRANLH